MIITCGECSTQFYLANKMLAPSGRKVKCSKCKAVWFQAYVSPPKIKLDKLDAKAKDKIFLPAVIEKKSVLPGWVFVSVFLCLALGSAFMLSKESFIVNGLEMRSFEIAHKKADHIDINGTIENNAGTYTRVPPMTVMLFGENKRLLKSIVIPAPPKYLRKGDRYSFYRTIKCDFQTKPEIVSVKLANSTEVSFYPTGIR